MASTAYEQSLVNCVKRLKLTSSTPIAIRTQRRFVQQSSHLQAQPVATDHVAASPQTPRRPQDLRLPLAVQATYLNPLRRKPTSNIVTCELQLRSYSVRNLEIFTDFAMRAAYFLKLATRGPKPLPKITERWTVPRANFVHKKSQENFERITVRRSIAILGGHPQVVSVWLAYLQKHRYYGVGLKANVWEYSGLDAKDKLDEAASELEGMMRKELEQLDSQVLSSSRPTEQWLDLVHRQPLKAAWAASAAMGGAESAPSLAERRELVKVTPPKKFA